ncbi:hypothetical protein M231_06763 [Tremella mesenterica]|uniref:Uncharacterized protein n=1 Tax=Tremella mesenterica TaxID=5217 RepID=A0A4V1M380_TREME|nr:hypothetical protein M231_06763 [Tremella mesenterica]
MVRGDGRLGKNAEIREVNRLAIVTITTEGHGPIRRLPTPTKRRRKRVQKSDTPTSNVHTPLSKIPSTPAEAISMAFQKIRTIAKTDPNDPTPLNMHLLESPSIITDPSNGTITYGLSAAMLTLPRTGKEGRSEKGGQINKVIS